MPRVGFWFPVVKICCSKWNKHAGIVFQGPGIEEGQGLESFCSRDQMKQKPQVDPETGRLDLELLLLWG